MTDDELIQLIENDILKWKKTPQVGSFFYEPEGST